MTTKVKEPTIQTHCESCRDSGSLATNCYEVIGVGGKIKYMYCGLCEHLDVDICGKLASNKLLIGMIYPYPTMMTNPSASGLSAISDPRLA